MDRMVTSLGERHCKGVEDGKGEDGIGGGG